jgi:hypothetical protein
MATKPRGRAVVGQRIETDGALMLIIQVYAQAVRDARCRQQRLQHMALSWLNSEEARELAAVVGIPLPEGQITQRELPPLRQRNSYFEG